MGFLFIALFAIVPIAAALILTFKENGRDGAKKLLGRAFDLKRIVRKIWYVPTLFLPPFVYILVLGLMVLIGKPIPDAQFPVMVVPVLFLAFFIMALGEEVGWMGYAFEPMQEQWNTFKATLVLGLIWAIWHVFHYRQLPLEHQRPPPKATPPTAPPNLATITLSGVTYNAFRSFVSTTSRISSCIIYPLTLCLS
jgi:membrane protease YdiL (CAAX protease family)